jgi:hypothetical protein
VRALSVAPAVAAVLLVAGTAAGARDPRLERLALRPADMSFARSALIRSADLGTGWTLRKAQVDDGSPPDCKGQDYSAFTITGQAQTQFDQAGRTVLSRVELYRSHKQALGDFAVDDRPGTAACEGSAIRRDVARSARDVTVKLLSAKRLEDPRVGQRSVALRIVLGISNTQTTIKLYVDLVGFVRDRAIASVLVVAPGRPLEGAAKLAQTIASRLQRVA